MAPLNRALTAVFDLVLRPLQLVPPLPGVALISLATAAVVLLVMRATSDARAITAARTGMYAAILEMRLFNDDLRGLLRAQLSLLKGNAAYLRASLWPMLWLIVPMALLLVQFDLYYGHSAVAPGEPVLITAQLRDVATAGADPLAMLTGAPGGPIDVPGVWFPGTREVLWTVSPESAGAYDLRVRIGSDDLVKTLVVSSRVSRISPARVSPGWVNQLRYPSEPPLPAASAVRAIHVAYPAREIAIFGRRLSWILVYGVLSVLFILALAPAFRVKV
jgi:hypothetical protein